jgi:hypothetical protein
MKDIEEVIKQMAALVAETAEQLAPLVQATEQHIGPMGGEVFLPTATMSATALRSKAAALRQLCGISLPTQGLEE